MEIVYVFQDQYPWDVRAEKFLNSLAQAGHPTVIVSRNRTGAVRNEPLGKNIQVRRLPRGWGSLTRNFLNFPAFFSPIWIMEIVGAVRRQHAKLIIVRDLPLGPAAIFAGRIVNVPVIMDMAENYPAMIADTWHFHGRGPFDLILRNPKLLKILEKWTLSRMNCVITVSNESAERVRNIVADKGTQVCVVGNTPVLKEEEDFPKSELSRQMQKMPGLRLLYVGGLEECRGLDVAIRALAVVRSSIRDATLIVVGEGIGRRALRQIAIDEGVNDKVLLTGWLEPELVPGVIAEADICLVPHYVTEHTETTIPNKIYDYMLQTKPVVVTHSQSLRAIVEKNQCGIWYQDNKPEELAQAICELEDPQNRSVLGKNGRRIVLEKLNWSIDQRNLLNTISLYGDI